MKDAYPFRGWLWLCLGIVNLFALFAHLVWKAPIFLDIAGLAVCALVCFFQRRMDPIRWTAQSAAGNERELLISERAARITLKLMAIVLLAFAQFSGVPALTWGYYAALAMGAGIYYLAKAYYNSRI